MGWIYNRGQADRQTDGQNNQTDRQTDRTIGQTDRRTEQSDPDFSQLNLP